jgi:ABC-type molybdate transport system substrate-binding protein
MRTWSAIAAGAMLGCLSVANAGAGRADEVELMTTGAVEQIMKGLIPSFERVSGHKVAMNKTIVYATGLTTMVKHPDAANALVKYLSLPSSVPVIQKNGMNPVDVRR